MVKRKRMIKESVDVWDAYDKAMELLGAEELCMSLAKAMGTYELEENLKYIDRMAELGIYDEDEDEDEDLEESRKVRGRALRESRFTRRPRGRMLKERRGMKRDEIRAILNMLAKSQGLYGRILRDIEEMDDDTREDFWAELEAQNFQDDLDVVLYFEQ